MANSEDVSVNLDADLRRRLWRLFDAAKVIGNSLAPSVDEWAEFHTALANVPESQHGR